MDRSIRDIISAGKTTNFRFDPLHRREITKSTLENLQRHINAGLSSKMAVTVIVVRTSE